MARPAKIYSALPGKGVSLASYTRLYLGPDHLIQVTTWWTQETYRRFYFKDIQALLIQKTFWGKVWNGFWGLWTLFFAWRAFSWGGLESNLMAWAAVFGLVCVVVNTALGPTVRTQIQTAVQTERLGSINRLHRVRSMLARIVPLIETAQGRWPSGRPSFPAETVVPESPSSFGLDHQGQNR